MSKKTQNYLLAKTDLGEVKKGFHELPPEGHTYGKAPTKDKHGAREGIRLKWSSDWELVVAREIVDEGGRQRLHRNE